MQDFLSQIIIFCLSFMTLELRLSHTATCMCIHTSVLIIHISLLRLYIDTQDIIVSDLHNESRE